MRSGLIGTRPLLALLGMVCVLAMAAFAPAPEIARANGLLQRAETNLQSVAENLKGRTSPPGGAAGKLLANRLQQALGDLTPAKELIEKVPAGSEGRDEAAARYEAAAAEYNRLNGIMTGGAAPTTPQPAGTPLNYQQKEVLSGAEFHLREVEGNAQHLGDKVTALRAVDDPLSISHREIAGLLSVVENARRKAGFARESLSKLPADGEGVVAVSERLTAAETKIGESEGFLTALNGRLQDLINPANYPEFEGDLKRLRELSVMFANPQILQSDRVLAAETFAQGEAAQAESRRIAGRYARLVQQDTEQGRAVAGAGASFGERHAAFMAEAGAMKAILPDEIRADLQTARTQGDEAVAGQKPAWFTGGIPQTMGYAAERVTLLTAMDSEAGAAMRAALHETETHLKKQADSLRELIIRENPLPADRFMGAERDKAVETAVSGWKVQQAEFDLLAVRIPAEAWVRETKWTYSNGTWYFSDRSKLQVRLIIADPSNAELAIDRVVNVWKDHQKGDTMIGVPLWGIEDELQPSHFLLRSRIK
jgi:hypothetical protein